MDYQAELNRAINYTKSKLLEARSLNIEITAAVEIFNKVGEASSRMDYNTAFELLNKCNKKIELAVDQHIFKIISDCHMQIKEYPKLNFSIVKKHLDEANYLLQNKNYPNALGHAKRCQVEINETIKFNTGTFKQQAEEVYNEIKGILIQAREEENLDIRDAEDIFSSMEDSLSIAQGIKDYEDVIEYGTAFKNTLARARRRREKVIEKMESTQKIMDKMKLALDNISQHFELSDEILNFHTRSKKAFEDYDFQEAQECADQCARKLNDLTQTCQPDIKLEFLTKDLQPDLWNRANISVENKGTAIARDIKFQMNGPVEIRRIPVIDKLGINEKKELEVGIKFDGAGNIPIDLEIHAKRSWDAKKYIIQQELWLEVGRTGGPDSSDETRKVPEASVTDQ